VVVTSITALLGVAIYKVVSENLSGPVIGIPMIFLGIVLISDGVLITYARARYLPRKGLSDTTFKDWIIIGLAQGSAALPGVSRSGTTVSAMLLLGIKPAESFRLSFLALIPSSVGASLVTVLLSNTRLDGAITILTPTVIVVAIITAATVSLGLIRLLLRYAASARITILVFGLGAVAIFSGVASLVTGFG
jgi:undecaprenyl-diphosphatase